MGVSADGKVIEMSPTGNGDNGRDAQGRFAPGNRGGPGNPHAAQVSRLRSALLDAITPDDMRAIVAALIEKARSGDVHAASVLFDRVLGKPLEVDIIDRIEALEAQFLEVSPS